MVWYEASNSRSISEVARDSTIGVGKRIHELRFVNGIPLDKALDAVNNWVGYMSRDKLFESYQKHLNKSLSNGVSDPHEEAFMQSELNNKHDYVDWTKQASDKSPQNDKCGKTILQSFFLQKNEQWSDAFIHECCNKQYQCTKEKGHDGGHIDETHFGMQKCPNTGHNVTDRSSFQWSDAENPYDYVDFGTTSMKWFEQC